MRLLGLLACWAIAGTAAAATPVLRVLEATVGNPTAAEVIGGGLDAQFTSGGPQRLAERGQPFWLKLQAEAGTGETTPVLIAHSSRFIATRVQVYPAGTSSSAALRPALQLPDFAGLVDLVYVLPPGADPQRTVYVHVEPGSMPGAVPLFSTATLDAVLARADGRLRMIALSFGALTAMALAALLMWVLMAEVAFIFYSALFFLQALYVAYFSGQAFDWPVLSAALPLSHYAWNVPAALSGAAACLFVREIADLRRFAPRIYPVYGWLAAAFVLLTIANVGKLVGLATLVNALGNILFLGSAVFTLSVCVLAWSRGSRAAGWFLFAWSVMEGFVIATAVHLLTHGTDAHEQLLYTGLPLSMVAAAVLTALGIADRLREQRLALTEAERRAQTDSLTGVLNRRSLIERLDAACLRARARGLPISLLFIDLDHFKQINDSFGHQAGDACLAAIIPPIQAELRQSDVIGRYGGEEFVVILSSADAAAAHPIAQRILERVAGVRVEGFGEPIALTCSIGVATSDTLGVWGEHLIAHADAAVYAAKRSGRNRVQFAMPLAA
ncbi:MAG TPA: diguanylate cyclase [Steroidobacteraceae bacterium]|nr:diguanylate cyclase [Steroidobacteraceae bacterium]